MIVSATIIILSCESFRISAKIIVILCRALKRSEQLNCHCYSLRTEALGPMALMLLC